MSQTPARFIKDERDRRRRIRESVQRYYEVEGNQQQQSAPSFNKNNIPSSTTTKRPAAGATTSNNNQPQTTAASMDLDSTSFNATAYTTTLMRQSTLPKLLETDTVLRHSVKTLDKELQDLVYSNYSKFIAAAETIKEVRSSVLDMESKLEDLDENVEKMEAVSSRVTKELERHRHLVDQEVATNSMLRKVQFLVMLPQIMENAARAEKWIEAAQYWSAGDAIFTKYSEFPSFVRTQNDCRLKAEQLYATLSRKICIEDTSSLLVVASPANNNNNSNNTNSGTNNNNNNNGSSMVVNNNNNTNAINAASSSSSGTNDPSLSDQNAAGATGGNTTSSLLASKLSALRLLANTSVDVERLQKKMNVVLVPTIINQETKEKDLNSVIEKARDVLYKKVFSEFQEQTKDTIAHIRIDFLHRKEDLERHAKKVLAKIQQQQRENSNNNNNQQQQTSSSSTTTNVADLAEDIKASLMDLSLALRKRYIAKLEEIIRDSFRTLAGRMKVIQGVVDSCVQYQQQQYHGNSNEERRSRSREDNNNTNNTNASSDPQADQTKNTTTTTTTANAQSSSTTSTSTNSLPSTTTILEQALSKIFDEICSCTHTWMLDCLETFSDCIVDASVAFNKSKSPDSSSSAASLLLLNVGDVDTLINGMCETFFDAILDTEKTIVGIAKRFFVTSSTSSSSSNDMSGGNSENASNNNTNASSISVAKKFEAKVSKKTEQLLLDLQKVLNRKESEVSSKVVEALDEEKFADEVEFFDENKKFLAKEDALTRAIVPLVFYAAFARTASFVLPKSDLAAQISWIHNKNTDDESSAEAEKDFDGDFKLQELTINFENAAINLASAFLRFCRVSTVTGEIRRGFFSSKFGFEATEPTEASDMMMRICRTIRHRAFVLQLLFSSGSLIPKQQQQNTATASSSSSTRKANVPQLYPNFPVIAQFMRKDVVGGVRADMDRIFAPKNPAATTTGALSSSSTSSVAGISNKSSDAANINKNNNIGNENDSVNNTRIRLLQSNHSSWYTINWPMDAASITETLIIMVLTSIVETVRESGTYFSKAGSQQLQVDASYFLHFVSELKMSQQYSQALNKTASSSSSSSSATPTTLQSPPLISSRVDEIVISLVNEFACSVFDRTKERAPLSNSVVEQIAYTTWKNKRGS